jgi:hypothetical protein
VTGKSWLENKAMRVFFKPECRDCRLASEKSALLFKLRFEERAARCERLQIQYKRKMLRSTEKRFWEIPKHSN